MQQRARDLVESGRAERGRSLLSAEQYRRCNSTHHVAAGWANGRPLIQALGGQPYPAKGAYITNGSTPLGTPVQFLGCGTRLNQQTRRRRAELEEPPVLLSPWWYENFEGSLTEPAGVADLFIFETEPAYEMDGSEYIPPQLICFLLCNSTALFAARDAAIAASNFEEPGWSVGTEGCFLFWSSPSGPLIHGLDFSERVCEYGVSGEPEPGAQYAGLTVARVYSTGGQLKMRGRLTKEAGTPTAQIRLAVFRLGATAIAASAGSIEGLREQIFESYLTNGSPDPALEEALGDDPLTRFWWLNNLVDGAWHGEAATFEAIGLEPYRLFGFDTNAGAGDYEFQITEFDGPASGTLADRLVVTLNGDPADPTRYVYYTPAGDGMIGAGGVFNPLLTLPSGVWLVFGFVQAYEETGAIALDIEWEVGID